MRLTPKGSQQILNLRVHVQSKRRDSFWEWYQKHKDATQTQREAAQKRGYTLNQERKYYELSLFKHTHCH